MKPGTSPQASYVGRFAPSPTGPLHLGSLLAATISWLDARSHQGRWHVRIEDLDPPRSMPGADADILSALETHGLAWDGPVIYQSTRVEAYRNALANLSRQGLLFECRCSRRAIRAAGGVYPGTCRTRRVPEAQLDTFLAGDAALRMQVPEGTVSFVDRRMGPCDEDVAAAVGDFVLRRRDGLWAYQLAVVVDDHALGVTDVVRGQDLLTSTARQIVLQRALGLETPRYLHHGLLLRGDGHKLAKQTGATGIDSAQAPANTARILASLGLPSDAQAPPAAQLANALLTYGPDSVPTENRQAAGLEAPRSGSATIGNTPADPDDP